ncbi:MAG: sensor histidine kinase, partial [Chloroflexota bacterium]
AEVDRDLASHADEMVRDLRHGRARADAGVAAASGGASGAGPAGGASGAGPGAAVGGSGGQIRLSHEGYEGGLFGLVVGANGRVLSNPQRVQVGVLALAAAAGAGPRFRTVQLGGQPARLYIRPVATGPAAGADLVVGESLAAQEKALHSLLLIMVASSGAALVVSLAGAWFLAGKALGPIQRAFRRQREFAADASHELRTPLTVLRSATDLLNQHRDEPLEANGELFEDLRLEIARLERLTEDLLTLARSDLGELALAVCEVDVAALAADVVRRLGPLARERGVALEPPAAMGPVLVEADPDRLQQVLLILLDNALKHTAVGGRVTVKVERHAGEAGIEVADTGKGIAPEHLGNIFERFYRADPARSAGDGGAGLGLAIARAVVGAHGGRLAVHSEVGVGTTASVRLRMAHEPAGRRRVGGGR